MLIIKHITCTQIKARKVMLICLVVFPSVFCPRLKGLLTRLVAVGELWPEPRQVYQYTQLFVCVG